MDGLGNPSYIISKERGKPEPERKNGTNAT
jgi:hypothetical protein